jgi:hypothetical protein
VLECDCSKPVVGRNVLKNILPVANGGVVVDAVRPVEKARFLGVVEACGSVEFV